MEKKVEFPSKTRVKTCSSFRGAKNILSTCKNLTRSLARSLVVRACFIVMLSSSRSTVAKIVGRKARDRVGENERQNERQKERESDSQREKERDRESQTVRERERQSMRESDSQREKERA